MNETLPYRDDPQRLRRVDEVCDRFENDWRARRHPRIEDFLTGVEDASRLSLLRELLKLELDYRRKRGENPTPDEYLKRFAGEKELVASLFRPMQAETVGLPESNGDMSDPPPGKRPDIPGYEILGVLGRGGMGVVYKAKQLSLNRLVALKMILGGVHTGPAARERFRREAEATARLQHPNIVQIHDHGEADGLPYLVLEFVGGGSLALQLDGKPRPPRDAVETVVLLAQAVDYAHKQGIVHRDLKPGNVLLTAAGEPKIADFGLAKMTVMEPGVTASGAICGTPSYMSPEQARGDTETVDKPADIYALGVILFELLTGRVPFTADNPISLLRKVEQELPPSLRSLCRDVPRDLEAVSLMCLEKSPARRYHSATDLARDLACYSEGKPLEHARRIGPVGRFWRWCRRNPVATTLSAAVTLLACAIVGILLAADQTRGTKGDDSLERVRRSGQLVVAIDPEGAPYSMRNPDGKLVGIDVDVSNAVAARLGVKVDPVEVYFDWAAMVRQLDERRVDVLISCVSISEERARQVGFVEYARDPFVFAARPNTQIKTRGDLRDKVVIVQRGTRAYRAAEQLQQEGVLSSYITRDNVPKTFEALRDGSGHAVLEHRRIAAYHAGLGTPLELFPLDGIDPALGDQRLGIALRRDAKELLAAIEGAVAGMKQDESLKAILDKWEPH